MSAARAAARREWQAEFDFAAKPQPRIQLPELFGPSQSVELPEVSDDEVAAQRALGPCPFGSDQDSTS